MRVRLLFFAGLREAVGKKDQLLELFDDPTRVECSLRELVAAAEREVPEITRYAGKLMISINEERANDDDTVTDGDEVAFLPPISGGSGELAADEPCVSVQASPLSMDALLAHVLDAAHGGIVTFIGVVRDHARGQTIDHLEYEAYVPMAEAEMAKIVRGARERWPEARLALSHRVGRLDIGDPAVMIAAAAPHRPEAFEACRWAIDTLKQTVPIWKKEFGTEGTYWVEENP